MSRLLPAALIVAPLLIATIVWEARELPLSNAGSTAVGATAPQARRDATAPESGDDVQGWVATALERPLFREDRRPVRTAGEPARAANGTLRLTGVITGPFGNRAIFQTPDSAKPVVAEEKANLNGFVVRSIVPGKVVVVEPGGTVRNLTPSFGASEQPARRVD
jgi:hypothetical protein